MLTLAEILERFTARRTVELPSQAFEPVQADATAPVIVNGMAEMLHHIADQDRRIEELEAEIERMRKTTP